MEYEYIIEGARRAFQCEIGKGTLSADIEGESLEYLYRLIGSNCLSLQGPNGNRTVYFARDKSTVHVFIEGDKFILKIPDESQFFEGGGAGLGGGVGIVETPMPGTIIKFLVEEGEIVEEGQGLVIVEAMKMENEIRAPINAKVKKLNFQSGDAVDVGQPIIDLEALDVSE